MILTIVPVWWNPGPVWWNPDLIAAYLLQQLKIDLQQKQTNKLFKIDIQNNKLVEYWLYDFTTITSSHPDIWIGAQHVVTIAGLMLAHFMKTPA
jgi:uridine kinase